MPNPNTTKHRRTCLRGVPFVKFVGGSMHAISRHITFFLLASEEVLDRLSSLRVCYNNTDKRALDTPRKGMCLRPRGWESVTCLCARCDYYSGVYVFRREPRCRNLCRSIRLWPLERHIINSQSDKRKSSTS